MMDRIAIIGAGLMGHGLALVFARGGLEVMITDAFAEARGTVKARVVQTLASLGDGADAVDRITVADTLPQAVRDGDIVIEAAPGKAFAEAGFVRRTGSSGAARGAAGVKHIGHQVIETEGTAPETVQRMMALLTTLGKTPVNVLRDVPGFVGNRLQHALWREAVALVEESICDAETVDLVVKSSFWRRLTVLGPLENADLVGTDLTLDIHNQVLPHLNHHPGPSPYLEALNAAGKLGFKTNSGFRDWTEGEKTALRAKVLDHLNKVNALLGGNDAD